MKVGNVHVSYNSKSGIVTHTRYKHNLGRGPTKYYFEEKGRGEEELKELKVLLGEPDETKTSTIFPLVVEINIWNNKTLKK